MAEAKIELNKNKPYFKNFYTPFEEAKEEIWRRWNNKELRKRVQNFLGDDIPKQLRNKPKAVLVTYLATPDIYLTEFLKLIRETKLKPLLLEYTKDKFFAGNSDKYHIGKMFFYSGKGHNKGNKIDAIKIIDFSKSEGKPIKNIKTLWGENFVEFHHNILKAQFPETNNQVVDIYDWIHKKGSTPKKYYPHFLGLFMCHGVYFDNFLLEENEVEFNQEIVLPTFNKLYQEFGIKPLIVPIIPFDEERDLHWWCYASQIKKLFRAMIVI